MSLLGSLFGQLGSALSHRCTNVCSRMITWSKKNMSYAFLKTFPLIFAFFVLIVLYPIFNPFFNIHFLISGSSASISVNEEARYSRTQEAQFQHRHST